MIAESEGIAQMSGPDTRPSASTRAPEEDTGESDFPHVYQMVEWIEEVNHESMYKIRTEQGDQRIACLQPIELSEAAPLESSGRGSDGDRAAASYL
jgi:hypothetical protein